MGGKLGDQSSLAPTKISPRQSCKCTAGCTQVQTTAKKTIRPLALYGICVGDTFIAQLALHPTVAIGDEVLKIYWISTLLSNLILILAVGT